MQSRQNSPLVTRLNDKAHQLLLHDFLFFPAPGLTTGIHSKAQVVSEYLKAPLSEPDPDPDVGPETPRIIKILDLALVPSQDSRYPYWEHSRRAAFVLSSRVGVLALAADGRVCSAFSARLRKHISEPQARDPLFSVHFSWLFSKLFSMRKDSPLLQSAVDELQNLILGHVLRNADVLAYANLLTELTESCAALDFFHELSSDDFVTAVLTTAAFSVLTGEFGERPPDFVPLSGSLAFSVSTIDVAVPADVLSISRREVPRWADGDGPHLEDEVPVELPPEGAAALRPGFPWLERLDGLIARLRGEYAWLELKADTPARARRRALAILHAVEASESGGGLRALMTASCGAMEPVKLLLVCGVAADWGSVIAPCAFGLLRALLYPPPCALSQSELYSTMDLSHDGESTAIYSWANPEVVEAVEEYAPLLRFRRRATPQMIAAFPLFWNHEYVVRGEGRRKQTPLEFYSFCLLEDPPASDALNLAIMEVLKWKLESVRQIRLGSPETLSERTERVRKEDEVFLRFLNSKFPVQTEDGLEKDLRNLEEFLPIAPDSIERGVSQSALNGYAFALARLIAEWDAFTIEDAPTEMFYEAPEVITSRIGEHITEIRALMKSFREGRIKEPVDWDVVIARSPPPPDTADPKPE